MVSKAKTFYFSGIHAKQIDVQCQIASGMVSFSVVGLPDKSVAESRERIRAVFSSLGLSFPAKKIVVNLSPADVYKEGSHYDLPIIIALLSEMRIIPQDEIDKYFFMGELSLDGQISRVNGVLPAAVESLNLSKSLICPIDNIDEALWVGEGLEVISANYLIDIISHLKGQVKLSPAEMSEDRNSQRDPINMLDFKDVKGQKIGKRAAEIAAAGGHNLLMSGPPGSGKSMIASRMPSIMPDMTSQEILQTSMIYSISESLENGRLISSRPFRSPHHNCSMPAMIGGGSKAKPGEVSLANNGILFLDELPEFSRQVIDSIRQPIEDRKVTISRASSHITYPANFQLVAAMNPCKCGYLSDADRACAKAPRCARDYQAKISGPMLDRFDIYIEVAEQNPLEAFSNKENPETSEQIKARVIAAREIQNKRYKDLKYSKNSDIIGEDLYKFCQLEDDANALFEKGITKLRLSMRGHSKVLKTARTIADLASSETITKAHIAEALSYRQMMYSSS